MLRLILYKVITIKKRSNYEKPDKVTVELGRLTDK